MTQHELDQKLLDHCKGTVEVREQESKWLSSVVSQLSPGWLGRPGVEAKKANSGEAMPVRAGM